MQKAGNNLAQRFQGLLTRIQFHAQTVGRTLQYLKGRTELKRHIVDQCGVGRVPVKPEIPFEVTHPLQGAKPVFERKPNDDEAADQTGECQTQRSTNQLPEALGDQIGRKSQAQYTVILSARRNRPVYLVEFLGNTLLQPAGRMCFRNRRIFALDHATRQVDEFG